MYCYAEVSASHADELLFSRCVLTFHLLLHM